MSTAYNRFELLLTVVLTASYLRPKTQGIWAENEKTETTTKHIYGRKRNWPKLSKPVIFGAENENDNEFRSLSSFKPKLSQVKKIIS